MQCFNLPGGTRKRYAQLGDVIVAAVKKAEPRKEVKLHSIVRAVIVRQRKEYKREDGSYIRFGDNACVILADKKNPKGNRILGPIPRELRRKGFEKIVTMAKEVV